MLQKTILLIKKQSISTILIFIALTVIALVPLSIETEPNFNKLGWLYAAEKSILFFLDLNYKSLFAELLGMCVILLSYAIFFGIHIYLIFYIFALFKNLSFIGKRYLDLFCFMICLIKQTLIIQDTYRALPIIVVFGLFTLFIFYIAVLVFSSIIFLFKKGLKYANNHS
jgi:hypothetical protein